MTIKSKLVFLSSVLAVVTFALLPAVALANYCSDTPDKEINFHSYTSEIQTDERVYHVRACNKVVEWAVVTCRKELFGGYGAQCDDKRIGKTIIGCMMKADDETKVNYGDGDSFKIPGTDYPAVNTELYEKTKAQGGCSDAPEAQSPRYGKTFAIPKSAVASPAGTPAMDEEALALNGGRELGPSIDQDESNYDFRVFEDQPEIEGAQPVYRSGFCAEWDKLVGGTCDDETARKADEMAKKFKKEDGTFYALTDFQNYTDALITQGCNNSNSDPKYSGIRSTKMNQIPSASCSLLYRVSGTSGSNLLSKIIQSVYKWAASVVGIVAVLVIVFSGVEISMAGSGGEGLDKAKNRIFQSIIGIAILFLSGLILYLLNPTFFV